MKPEISSVRRPCNKCGALILPKTSENTGGLCMPCFNGLAAVKCLHDRFNQQLAFEVAKYERPFESTNGKPRSISLVELIACRRELHGKFVRVTGVFTLNIESVALYLSEQDAHLRIAKNAISLKAPDGVWCERSKYHEKYVVVEGIFDSGLSLGRHLATSGALCDISSFNLLRALPVI